MASDSASIFQQFMGMTAAKRRGMSEIPHPHAAHLPYLPEPRQSLWPFCMSISSSVIFRGLSFQFVNNIRGGLEKCYMVLHRVVGWSKNTIICVT